MLDVKGMRFPLEIILVCVRWYAAYPLSCRHLEEMMEERGVSVDHSTVSRWAVRFLPLLEKIFKSISARLAEVGGWTRLISRSKVLINISTVLSTKRETPLRLLQKPWLKIFED